MVAVQGLTFARSTVLDDGKQVRILAQRVSRVKARPGHVRRSARGWHCLPW
jgi:hypothetical protein